MSGESDYSAALDAALEALGIDGGAISPDLWAEAVAVLMAALGEDQR